jgi:K+-sensing histidine kinase KdpD
MFLVSLVISHLTTLMRQQTEIARLQERQVVAMRGLSRELASAKGIQKILQVAVRYISDIFDCKVVALLPGAKGTLNLGAGDISSVFYKDITKELKIAQSAFKTGQISGWGTQTAPRTEILYVPLQAGNASVGVLALRPSDPDRLLMAEQLRFMESLAKQVGLALEVERLTKRKDKRAGKH